MIATGCHHIPEDMFLIASKILAENVTDDDLKRGSLYPPLKLIKDVSIKIACDITRYAYSKGKSFVHSFFMCFPLNPLILQSFKRLLALCSRYPEPKVITAEFMNMYNYYYKAFDKFPVRYDWPEEKLPLKKSPDGCKC